MSFPIEPTPPTFHVFPTGNPKDYIVITPDGTPVCVDLLGDHKTDDTKYQHLVSFVKLKHWKFNDVYSPNFWHQWLTPGIGDRFSDIKRVFGFNIIFHHCGYLICGKLS